MKTVMMVLGFVLVLAGCQSSGPEASSGVTPMTVTTIDLREKDDCVKSTKTKTKKCSGSWKEDETCNSPGDTIIWQWQNQHIPFKISMKSGYLPPFEESACMDTLNSNNQIVCVIAESVDRGTFYEYNIEVEGCDDIYDPRILIY